MNENVTEIIFLLDRSGSMSGLEGDTIGGFNSFIEKQSKLPGRTKLTTILFDDRYEVLWNGVDATEAKLTEKDYFVRGATALLDAVGKTIVNMRHQLTKKNGLAPINDLIFVITTDGMENWSQEFTYEKVKELINEQKTDHNWEFIFLGANMDVVEEASNIGISKESAHHFEATKDGIEVMYETIHEMVMENRKSK